MINCPNIDWTPEFKETHEFYECQDDKVELSGYSMYEAIADYISEHAAEELREKYEENDIIEVYAFNRDIPSRDECAFMDDLLEKLDDERKNPHGDWKDNYPTGLLEKLRKAESDFIDMLLSGYTPWSCRMEAIVKVPFRDWLNTQDEDFRKDALGG